MLTEPSEAAITRAAQGRVAYLIDPTILHWEDRNTEWSGRPDRISVKLAVFDVTTRQTLDSVVIDGTSKWATLGGDHPQDLLPGPIGSFVAQLYGETPTKPARPSADDR